MPSGQIMECRVILAVQADYKPRGKSNAKLEKTRKYREKRRKVSQYGLKAARRAPKFSKR